MRAVISIGSNLGDRLGYLRSAVSGLPGVRAVSPVYETAPWGGVDQDDFLNAVVLADTELDPKEWLVLAHRLEDAAGRERSVRWGPRTLDVDLVDIEGVRRATDDLTLPHPRAAERAFVLVPWLDVEPNAVLPGHGPVDALAATLDTGVVRRTDLVAAR
ncbi:MAG: 2-amino-4-hydroxy-6-hydroxymethyldihydropteridine diphosphokinase [Mycobacteriales bacterium]